MKKYIQECKKYCETNKNVMFYICLFLLGVIVGFCISPMKKGIYLGSFNGSYNKNLTPEEDK